ncbi:MAG TPA: SDR family NAD(P)-dependent oxidoreductase [Terriglobia bacterium]|nr:SDR family NAD(P)-dependent oxidoreductase [Terriglobia bacterium]
MSLADHVALVTGASSGIGRAVALELARQQTRLCIVGRDPDRLNEVKSEAASSAASVLVFRKDLTLDRDIEDLSSQLQQEFGQLDILVHCAGEIASSNLETAAIDDLDRQYRANVRAPYLLTQKVLSLLKVMPGQIVFVNSSVGLAARPTVSQFAATQHAVRAMADSLRAEVNQYQIRVLSVFPGRTATPRQARIYQRERRNYQPDLLMQPEDISLMIASALRLPRTAEVTDISMRPLLKSY